MKALAIALSQNLTNPKDALRNVTFNGAVGEVNFKSSFAGNYGEGKLLKFVNGDPIIQ